MSVMWPSKTIMAAKSFQRSVLMSETFIKQLQVQRMKMSTEDTTIISLAEARRFMADCLMAVGTSKEHADSMAFLLAEADYNGHFSHGMNRIELYVNDIKAGVCDSKAKPKIIKETNATAWVDGQNGVGAIIGDFCMKLAIKKAKEVGVGWVAAKSSNHYGLAAFYTQMAIKKGMLGMSFTNTTPCLSPTRSKQAALGTNPIALGAPAKDGDSFVLDMATTAVAFGKIEIQKRKNLPIPKGWAQDKDGNVTTNAEEAFKAMLLMPLGGTELNSGYKGYGLAVLVEIFCGILSGSSYGPAVIKLGSLSGPADLGQSFVAINPDCFAPGFDGRMSDMMKTLRNLKPVDPNKPVMVHGDLERNHVKAVDKNGGVRYVSHQLHSCKKLAERLHVKPLQPLS